MRQLSGQDASFLYQETPNAPMHTAGINIYDPSTAPGGEVTFKSILASLESRLHLAPIFRERVLRVPGDIDHPWWINDETFDLEFHVRHIALPKPGDWRQLCIQVARLHSRPLDMSRPLWELTVIEGLDNVAGVPAGSYAYFLKTHHCAIDGASGVQLHTVMHDLTPSSIVPPPKHPWHAEAVPQQWELLAKAQANHNRRMTEYFQRPAMTPQQLERMNTMRQPAPLTVPRTRFNATVSAHRVFDGRVVELDMIRAARTSVPGATINDAVLAIMGGALRRYLSGKGELPDESVVAMVPVAVKTDREVETSGNSVASMLVPLGTHIADPVERLGFVRDATTTAKELLDALGAGEMTRAAELSSGAMIGLAARQASEQGLANTATPAYNTVVTNVPGPQVALYSNGARLARTHALGPVHDAMGLMNIISSYCGRMSFDFTADRNMMPDPSVYAECIDEAVAEIAGRAPRSAPARSAPSRNVPRSAPSKRANKTSAPVKVKAAKASKVTKVAKVTKALNASKAVKKPAKRR
jgi:diacylglycerol O-acyltransferase / wax synthase